jgi:hypothetical protein
MRLLRVLLTRATKMPHLPCALVLALGFQLAPIAMAVTATSPWDQPSAALVDQIASILGPGQAHLTLRNLSTISSDELPAIRRVLEQYLQSHGISVSNDEAANLLRITLSENQHERLWVAEVIEGTETKVVMAHLDLDRQLPIQSAAGIALHKQHILSSHEPILALLETPTNLVTLEPEQIRVYAHATAGWTQQTAVPIHQKRPLARDPRGILVATADGQGFEADVPGAHCDGIYSTGNPAGQWAIHCHESDDPWPVAALVLASGASTRPLKAFYNSARDYFTGIVAPNLGIDLPAFYQAAWIPHAATTALLLNVVDGKLLLVEGAGINPVAGARDWGSDFAILQSGCGSGTQIIASGSGPAAQDSLRAYEIPALEAIPAGQPLAVDGSVTAMWSAPGGKSAFAVLRNLPRQGQPAEYEVDRVTATCQ